MTLLNSAIEGGQSVAASIGTAMGGEQGETAARAVIA